MLCIITMITIHNSTIGGLKIAMGGRFRVVFLQYVLQV
jgi:hypothetical protein